MTFRARVPAGGGRSMGHVLKEPGWSLGSKVSAEVTGRSLPVLGDSPFVGDVPVTARLAGGSGGAASTVVYWLRSPHRLHMWFPGI